MSRPDDEHEPWERADMAAAANALAELHRSREGCPPLQVLRAAVLEALPDEIIAAVAKHTAGCASCQRLYRDIGTLPAPPDMTAAGERRVWTTVESSTSESVRKGWFALRLPLPARLAWAASTVIVVIGLAAWLTWPGGTRRPQHAPDASRGSATSVIAANPVVAQPEKGAAAAPVAPLEKPEVKLTLAMMTWRGDGSREHTFVDDIGPALQAFRADRYEEAARRLESLVNRYPQSVEVPYYLGICRLFLGRNTDAVQVLRTAQRLADDTFRGDATWYLALALERAGQVSEARAAFASLCKGSGVHAAPACRAAAVLDGRAARQP